MTTTKQNNKRNHNRKIELAFMRLLMAVLRTALLILVVAAPTAQAGETRQKRHHHRSDNRNYILRRQEAYQVQGVPTSRLIIGRREIDVYPNGMMFEGDNLVGVRGKKNQ
jgi:hypothetical protein